MLREETVRVSGIAVIEAWLGRAGRRPLVMKNTVPRRSATISGWIAYMASFTSYVRSVSSMFWIELYGGMWRQNNVCLRWVGEGVVLGEPLSLMQFGNV